MMARLRLTTKQVNGGYYKGNRTGSMGHWGKNGSTYIIDWNKVRTYVVPDSLSEFKLTPFVTNKMPPTKSKYTKEENKNGRNIVYQRALEGEDYLQVWALENARESIALEENSELLGQKRTTGDETK